MLPYTEGIRDCLRQIFGAVLIGGLKKGNPIENEKIRVAKTTIPRFIGNFPYNIFENEYAVFYDIIVNLNIKVFNKSMLSDIIDNNRDIILSSPYVDLSAYSYIADGKQTTDDEKIDAFKANLDDILDELSNILVTEDEFNSACVIYTNWYKEYLMKDTINKMALIMSDEGLMIKKDYKRARLYKGLEDAQKFYNERQRVIRSLSSDKKVKEVIINEKWFEQELEADKFGADKPIFTFGIKEIDEVVGGLRRTNFLGILGPPKGGKTRFTNYIVQRALSLGLNVAVWPLEGDESEWMAMQTASYIKRTTNVSIDSQYILFRDYVNDPRKRKYVVSAKLALATDPKMGRLSFIDAVGYVEDFLDVIQAHYDNVNPFDLLVIDSLVNIMSKTGRGKVERISEAYMNLKTYITSGMNRPPIVVVPAQLKQSIVDYLRAHPDETIDVTAGAESAETIRTPDQVIGLFSSKEERAANIMRIYSVAGRHNRDFDDFMVGCDLQCCHFYSNEELNK